MKHQTLEEMLAIDRVEVDTAAIAGFTSEEQFTELAVRLMVESASYTCVAACTLGSKPVWDRNQAAVCGNMVRLYKLLDAVLDQTCKRRQEVSFILARLVFETIVNIRFLIQEFSTELIDSYVSFSLRHERKLRDSILHNISKRGGRRLPIEERMLKSINRSASAAGLSLDSVDLTKKGPWGGKNLYEKAEAVGLSEAYLAAFGGASHSVHGNWHELYGNHLHWDENGGFTPNTGWHIPRPQLLLALCSMVIETLAIYFAFIAGETVELVDAQLADLHNRLIVTNDAHEAYLSKRTWPKI
jgi:hypothetical protein